MDYIMMILLLKLKIEPNVYFTEFIIMKSSNYDIYVYI